MKWGSMIYKTKQRQWRRHIWVWISELPPINVWPYLPWALVFLSVKWRVLRLEHDGCSLTCRFSPLFCFFILGHMMWQCLSRTQVSLSLKILKTGETQVYVQVHFWSMDNKEQWKSGRQHWDQESSPVEKNSRGEGPKQKLGPGNVASVEAQ